MVGDLHAHAPQPLVREVPYTDPACLLSALVNEDYLALLDSAVTSQKLGRYSFLGFSPFALFRVADGLAYWNDAALDQPAFIALNTIIKSFSLQPVSDDLPPFLGGAIGYFSYEAGRLLEKLPQTSRDSEKLDEILLPFYDVVLAVDHYPPEPERQKTPEAKLSEAPPQRRAYVVSSGWPFAGEDRLRHAQERLDWFCDKLKEASLAAETLLPREKEPAPIRNWQADLPREAFEQSIAKTRAYIRQGDIFQANITQRFSAPLPDAANASPLAYYHAMRRHNAAPFAAFLNFGDHVIASSSPERFITLSNKGEVETRPIKGTAPRDLRDAKNDAAFAQTLMESEKDRAENIMITDLMRNDLSRVCEPGSIMVPQLCALESYARVHHLVSTVTGKLKGTSSAVALLGASFPGGSITGAPKIRSMEIIAELEDLPRGVYCGSIGYISFDGSMDTNIAIRTVTFKNGQVHFSVGGGITILSDPAEEYEECLHKAAALFKSFGTSLEEERANLERGPTKKTGVMP